MIADGTQDPAILGPTGGTSLLEISLDGALPETCNLGLADATRGHVMST